jgi:ribosome recycling factor
MPEIKIQQEGPYLHIQAQQLTREERRERINRVKASLVNEYKKALNAVRNYTEWSENRSI